MEKSFFTSSPSPRADLIGGIVPFKRKRIVVFILSCRSTVEYIITSLSITEREKFRRLLTSVVVCGGELGGLVPTARAVTGSHFQLVPRGLPQLAEEQLSGGVGLEGLPGPGAFRPEVQHQVSDGAASAGPALQVQAGVSGIDVSEQRLVLVEDGFC